MKIRFEIELPELVLDESTDQFWCLLTDTEIEDAMIDAAWCEVDSQCSIHINQDDLKEFIKQVKANGQS